MSAPTDKEVQRVILRILKDKKVHRKDELVKKIAKSVKLDYQLWIKKENQTKGKQRDAWERRIVRNLSILNKAGLIIHDKDKNGKYLLTYFCITKCGLGALSLI